jgi:macrolide-specific efflux system membrane fusion protein
MRRDRPSRPWHLYGLGAVAVVVGVLAWLEVGPPSSQARTSREVVTAASGVVQSTVTGSGNVEPATDVDANFRTSGTLQNVYVKTGQYVTKGQLLATLDPTSAQLSVEQAEESLTSAEDQLTAAEDGTSTGSSGTAGSSTSGSGGSANYTGSEASTEFVSYHRPGGPTRTTTTTTTTTTPKRTGPPPGSSHASTRPSHTSSSPSKSSTKNGSGSGTQTTTTPSPASIASAEASVYSAEESVHNAEQTLSETKLAAPTSGTIVSMSGLLPGDAVSAGSTTSGASSSSSSSNSSSTSGTGLVGGSSTAGSLGSSSASSTGSSSSSSPFAEIVNSGSMMMTVSFSESDITKVHVGQPATVTLDALSGVELGAAVTQISDVGSSSSGVVSYNATLTINQHNSQVKPGMSASAAVIVGQAQGVTVPNEAVSGTGSLGTVNVLHNGRTVSKQVVVGLRGDSRTQIVSGLSPGQQLVVAVSLPSLSTSSSSGTSSSTGILGGGGFRGLGAGGLGAGGLGAGGLGAGRGAFFRGGG